MGVTVRRMSAKDAPVAAQVVISFSREVVPSGYMVRLLGNPANFLLVADHNSEVAGFLLAYTLERLKEAARMVFIYEIEVANSYRRIGIGTALISAIRDIAVGEGIKRAFVITTYTNTAAVAFYQHTGGECVDGDEVLFRYSW